MLRPQIGTASQIAIPTGIILFAADPSVIGAYPFFRVKLAMAPKPSRAQIGCQDCPEVGRRSQDMDGIDRRIEPERAAHRPPQRRSRRPRARPTPDAQRLG
ncbi:MAG: hypothetical protein ACREIR_17925 [Geminicoccaceae bacterium]